jgi:predicted small secreted protein
MKKQFRSFLSLVLLVALLCSTVLTGCESSSGNGSVSIVPAPLDVAISENVTSDMEEIDSKVMTNFVQLKGNELISTPENLQVNAYTYVIPDSVSQSDSSALIGTYIVDIEFLTQVELTSDSYLCIDTGTDYYTPGGDYVSPTTVTGTLYYKDSPEDDWIYAKDVSAQPLFSLTQFTFLGSDLKTDNKAHYYRLVAVSNDADCVPTADGQVSYLVTYQYS